MAFEHHEFAEPLDLASSLHNLPDKGGIINKKTAGVVLGRTPNN